jgi:trk system potassium uptake protein TrkA
MARRNRNNEYVVIGLGRFGSSLARELTKRGASVLGIDRDPELVQRYAEEITETVTLDSTDESALSEVDVFSYKTVIVAIGDNFEASLITTSILKQHNVPQVIAKALTERQKDILGRMGADRVILPEHEAGEWLSHQLLHPGVIEYFDIGPNFTISEVTLPESWVGRMLQDLDLRKRCNATILVVKRGASVTVVPPSGFVFEKNDVIVVFGPNKMIDEIYENENR